MLSLQTYCMTGAWRACALIPQCGMRQRLHDSASLKRRTTLLLRRAVEFVKWAQSASSMAVGRSYRRSLALRPLSHRIPAMDVYATGGPSHAGPGKHVPMPHASAAAKRAMRIKGARADTLYGCLSATLPYPTPCTQDEPSQCIRGC